jgi:hypothetical protein
MSLNADIKGRAAGPIRRAREGDHEKAQGGERAKKARRIFVKTTK